MATYIIGDIQGCFAEFQALLAKIQFDSYADTLWLTGDLVNRGPSSLAVLRFVRGLGDKHITVLGNHDLHLLAVAYGVRDVHQNDTLAEILSAPDRDELIQWLLQRQLLHYDATKNIVLVHAGLAPMWTLNQAQTLAHEVETVLRGDTPALFLQQMYGNEPNYWDDKLTGVERLRCITNYLTRMRFCHANGQLDLTYKGQIAGKPDDVMPWFAVPHRVNINAKIMFGHWAALGGETHVANVYALDTGCVWGNCLTAMRLEDEMRFSVRCG